MEASYRKNNKCGGFSDSYAEALSGFGDVYYGGVEGGTTFFLALAALPPKGGEADSFCVEKVLP